MDLGAWSEATWATAAALATVVLYVLLLAFTAVQVRQARNLQEEQARPYVVVQFEPDFIIHFIIENMGRTVARNVHVTFDQRPVTTLDYPPWTEDSESPVLREGIPFLAPGGRMRFIFDNFPNRVGAGLPLLYQATVAYESDWGRAYSDPYTLDLSLYKGVLEVDEKGLHEVATSLDKIRSSMETWTDRGAVRVNVSSRYLGVLNERRQWDITLAKRAYRAGGWTGVVKHWRDNFIRRHGLYSLDE